MQCRQQLCSNPESWPSQSRLFLVSSSEAYIEHVDAYMELMYGEGSKDELRSKIQGTEMIVQLCLRVEYLEILIQNRQLMSALARLWNEEYQRSAELTFNICRIFLAFSNFVETHHILSSFRVGVSAMKILELEVSRSMKSLTDSPSDEAQLSSERHDYVIYVVLQLLLNLAEDSAVERKMVKKSLISLLCQCIKLPSKECALVSLALLNKLSIFEENVVILADPDLELIPLLLPLLSLESVCGEIVEFALSLMFNLSFFASCRKALVERRCMNSLVYLMASQPSVRTNAIRVIYHLCGEAEAAKQIAETELAHILLGLVRTNPKTRLGRDLAALAVNVRTAVLRRCEKCFGAAFCVDSVPCPFRCA